MAKFSYTALGEIDDRVRIQLGNDEILVAESYEVRSSILSQPSGFSLRLGGAASASKLLAKYPPNTPFKLFIGPVLQASGNVDGVRADGSDSGMSVTFEGRDRLAPLFDAYVKQERSYLNSTYLELVTAALTEAVPGDIVLSSNNRANRSVRAGVSIQDLATDEQGTSLVAEDVGASFVGGQGGTVQLSAGIATRLGERWYEFLRRYLDRAGLFLWAGANGEFILSRPNAKQQVATRLIRLLGDNANKTGNVIRCHFDNVTTHRHAKVTMYARGGGRKSGRARISGVAVDHEMGDMGFTKELVMRDVNIASPAHGVFLATRKLAEERREGFQLLYTVAGHSTPAIGSGERCVWTPDTLVDVADEMLGIEGTFYIEECTYSRSPQTTTTLRLMRTTDLLFGGIADAA